MPVVTVPRMPTTTRPPSAMDPVQRTGSTVTLAPPHEVTTVWPPPKAKASVQPLTAAVPMMAMKPCHHSDVTR